MTLVLGVVRCVPEQGQEYSVLVFGWANEVVF